MKIRKLMPKYEKHKKLYCLIRGGVLDAFKQHPEYLAENADMHTVITSITKRVTGLVLANPHLIHESKSLNSLLEAHVKSNDP